MATQTTSEADWKSNMGRMSGYAQMTQKSFVQDDKEEMYDSA